MHSDHPAQLRFSASLALVSAQADDGPRRFSGVAYAGGVIKDHGYWPNGVAFDLDSTTLPESRTALLFEHDTTRPIGVIEAFSVNGGKLIIDGYLLDNDDANRIADSADQGFPWQLSVGIYPDNVITLSEARQLSQQSLPAGISLFTGNRLREVSIVALGADDKTSASIFSHSPTPQEPSMDLNQATAEIEQLKAENAQLKQDIAKFTAKSQAQHKENVKAFFKDIQLEFSSEHAAPWLAMTPEQFSAASALIRSTRSAPPALPAELFGHQANGGKPPSGTVEIDREAIFAARRSAV